MNDPTRFTLQRERVLKVIEQFGLLSRPDAERRLLPSIRIHAGSTCTARTLR